MVWTSFGSGGFVQYRMPTNGRNLIKISLGRASVTRDIQTIVLGTVSSYNTVADDQCIYATIIVEGVAEGVKSDTTALQFAC